MLLPHRCIGASPAGCCAGSDRPGNLLQSTAAWSITAGKRHLGVVRRPAATLAPCMGRRVTAPHRRVPDNRSRHPNPHLAFDTPSQQSPDPQMLSLANSLIASGVGVPRMALCAAATCLPELLRNVSTTAAAEVQRRVSAPKRSADSTLWKPAPARKMSAEAKDLHDRQELGGRGGGFFSCHRAGRRLCLTGRKLPCRASPMSHTPPRPILQAACSRLWAPLRPARQVHQPMHASRGAPARGLLARAQR